MRNPDTASYSRRDVGDRGTAPNGGRSHGLCGMWNEGTDQKVRAVQGRSVLRKKVTRKRTAREIREYACVTTDKR